MSSNPHRVLSQLLFPFRFFGICLIGIPLERTANRYLVALNICNILLEASLLWVCFENFRLMFDFSHTIGLTVDVLQIIGPILTHVMALLESQLRRRRLTRLWNTLMELIETGGPRFEGILRSAFKRFIWTGTVCFAFCSAIEFWILGNASTMFFRSRIVSQWALMSSRAVFLLYVLHVASIGGVLEMVAQELKYAACASKSRLKSRQVEMERKEIRKILQFCNIFYGKAFQMAMEDLGECFGWSLILNFVYNFLNITIALYYNYRRVVSGLLTIGSILVSIPLMTSLIATIYECEQALRPMRRIAYHLHRVERHPENLVLHREIMRLSYQLRHQQIQWKARRLIDINFKLLKGVSEWQPATNGPVLTTSLVQIIASISVYLVIIVQFAPKAIDTGNYV